VEQIDAWWVDNRPTAPGLFADELAAAFGRLASFPHAGTEYPHSTVAGIRRLLLQRTRYHVYYLTDDTEGVVSVLAVWHASRGSGPPLV